MSCLHQANTRRSTRKIERDSMIKPQAIRQIESKRFNKEFSTFPDLDSLKQFCKNTGIFNSVSYKQNYKEYGLPAH
ncbi:hypothetical protein RFX60_08880, partial [Acinetobacter sp. 11520]|nr:hypothetical protein [Acinetobacter sp. 11520]